MGVSHRTSPIELRERLAVPSGQLVPLVTDLRDVAGLREAVLVSTCNRVELYAAATESDAIQRARRWLEERSSPSSLAQHLYSRTGEEALRHTFRVAASLDSMVVGEPQILGQVKEAYATAQGAGLVGGFLDRVFARAFAVAKRVRNETGVASGAVSVSSIACDLAKKIFEDLEGKRVLLIGAGKMGESAAKHLAKQGAKLFVLNRSRERAVALAEAAGGEPRSLAELPSELALADVAICSTSSERFVVTTELMKSVVKQRKYRPLFLIDIAVPRDVDPHVGQMENVFLYDVDDLQKVAAENLVVRRREAELAEQIVDDEVREFESWRRQQELKPMIIAIREHTKNVLMSEVEKTLPKLAGDAATHRAALERMVESQVNKTLHPVLTELKRASELGDTDTMKLLVKLYGTTR